MDTIKIAASSLLLLSSTHANAESFIIEPSDDGSIYTCTGCNPVSNATYVTVSGYIQGVIKFPMDLVNNSVNPVESAQLSINPYALPVWDKSVDIYAYTDELGYLVASDGNAGVFLGTLQIPENIGYGESVYFDVTDIISIAGSPYISFNLRTDSGSDLFSSLEYNYGNPSQLIIQTAEPPPAPVLDGSHYRKGRWIYTTLSWTTEAQGVDVYYNGELIETHFESTSATYSNVKQEAQVYVVCNTGTSDCSDEYVSN